ASMTRAMLEEVRQATVDDAGRARLLKVHKRSLDELRGVLSEDLLDEFNDMFVPITETPTTSELRIAQAQLIGWLEGLFHGIQAGLWSQQLAAQSQLAEMQRRRQLGPGPGKEPEERFPGAYL
ncbi:MAG: proteasome activator, partial [Acidimicrobiia bacterium]